MAKWTAEQVAEQFREAAQTAYRLPPVRVQGYFNGWPTIIRQAWETYALEEECYRFPPTPEAIDRMVETTRWMIWLEEEQRHLIWMCAHGRRWRDICGELGCNRTTAWRHWQKALQVVMHQLNDRGD